MVVLAEGDRAAANIEEHYRGRMNSVNQSRDDYDNSKALVPIRNRPGH